MNLYIFNRSSPGAVFGIGTYINELTQALGKSSIHITVVQFRSDQASVCFEETDGIRYWSIPAPQVVNHSMGYDQQMSRYSKNVVYLLRLYIKKTDNLIFQFNYTESTPLILSIKKVFNCKTIAVIHYFEWMLKINGNIKQMQMILKKDNNTLTEFEKLVYKELESDRKYYQLFDMIICLAQYSKKILKEYCIVSGKILVTNNGLNDFCKKQSSDKNLLLKQWRFSSNEKIILFVGRLNPSKGLSYLINSFREVLVHFPNCRLIIAGDGDFSRYTKETGSICTNVTYTGFLGKKQLYELYSVADIGVLPSLTEQCSYVAIEMMMHSLPMITTSANGLAKMTENGLSSIQVPVVDNLDNVEIDTKLLAQKMLYLLQHPEEAKLMGKNARRRYLKHYSSEVFRKNMLEIYDKLFSE